MKVLRNIMRLWKVIAERKSDTSPVCWVFVYKDL